MHFKETTSPDFFEIELPKVLSVLA